MQPRRILVLIFATVGFCSLSSFSGCGDDSKTTGTQVQISPETKAAIDEMRTAQKEQKAERKLERQQERQARKKR